MAARPGYRVFYLLAIFATMGGAYGGLAEPAFGQENPGNWSPQPSMPTPRRLLAAAVEGKAIYTFGGCGSPCFAPPLHTSTLEETRLEVFENGEWSVRKRIPAILFGAAAAAVPKKHRIYLFGGFVTGSTTYEYNPEADSWSRKAAMPTPRYGLAAVTLNGKIYVLGGSNGSAATGALEVYDPDHNSWSQKAPMPTPRVFLAAAVVNGKIYAIGGSPDCCGDSGTDVVEVYDPITNSWSRAASLPKELQVSAAVTINDKIYVFGGFIPGSGVQGSTFEYDPAMNKWSPKADMQEPRDQAPAVVLGGIAHVVGGSVACHCQARDTHDSYTPPSPPLQPMADLEIQKESVPPDVVVSPGQTLKYRIKVTNLGPDAVSGATVMDDLKATGLQHTCWCLDSDCPPARPCPPSRRGNLSDIVALEANHSVVYEVTGTVPSSATGGITNVAKVVPPAKPQDKNPRNNSATTTNPIEPPVDCEVSITKTASPSPVAPGDEISYTITVDNTCPAAVQATVTDDLTATGLTDIQWCRGSHCDSGDIDETVELPANGSVTYEVTGTVPCACRTTQIENTACVTAPGHPEDCSSTTVPILPAPGGDLALTIASPSHFRDCGPQPYVFTVTNPGPGIACEAVLRVEPPAGSERVSISGPCTGLPCELGNMAPGAQVQVTAVFSLPGGLGCPATLSTTATVSACDGTTKTFETEIPCVFSVTKSDGLETACSGDPIQYTIDVKNQGCATLEAEVKDVFPTALENVQWCPGAICVPAGPHPFLDALILPPGGIKTYRVEGTVASTFTGDLVNTVTVSPPESAPVSATDRTTVNSCCRKGLTTYCAALSGDSFEGGMITKTFVITSDCLLAQGDNPGPEFEDTLPAGLTLVSASADSGTVTTLGNTVRWDGSIPAGGTVTVLIMATIDLGTTGMKLCNGATTFFDTDGDGVNESSRLTNAPCCFQVMPVALVPSLSGPGLAVLVLLLCALAIFRIRRRYP